jgi:hypothetical protein
MSTATKTRKPRLTKTEQAAQAFARHVKGYGFAALTVEWRKSDTWGRNAYVTAGGFGTLAKTSGCGYDKESSALADALRFLADNEEDMRSVWVMQGGGFYSVQKALAAIGWKLTRTSTGKTEDGFSISRMSPQEYTAARVMPNGRTPSA